ncbi:unnamed protein product [Ectocarpus fasciculatus]
MDTVINLMSGQPAGRLLPADLVASAATEALQAAWDPAEASSPLNYGDNHKTFSRRIAELLMAHDNRPHVDPALIMPTSGVSHALDALCTMLCRRHRNRSNAFVFVEDATYYLASDIFRDHGLDIRKVSTDHGGLVVEDLQHQLEALNRAAREDDSSAWPVLLYVIPNFHNPTGRSLSEERKRRLCDVAERFGLPVVADEVYNLLNYSSLVSGVSPSCPIPTSMSALGCPQIISVSSFSKILAPGLRVGWVEFPTIEYVDMYSGLGFYCSGSNTSQFSSCVVLKTMEQLDHASGQSVLVTHINRLRAAYAEGYEALTGSINKHSQTLLPAGEKNQLRIEGHGDPSRPIGGYFLWVKIPDWAVAVGPKVILEKAQKDYNLLIRLGEECAALPGLNTGYIRLCFAKLPPSALEEGGRRLCLLFKNIYESKS